ATFSGVLPPLRQRLLIAAAIVAGGLIWMCIDSGLLPGDGTSGITLIDARVGAFAGVALVLLSGVVAVAGAILCGAIGNPLAAPFVLASALLFLAADGGSSLGFLWRTTPGEYLPLFLETVFWFGIVALTMWLTQLLRAPLR